MEDGKIVSLRMGTEDVQTMDDYLEMHPELGGRSLFIRTAVREYIDRDGTVAPKKCNANEIALALPRAMLETIDSLVDDGIYLDRAEAVRTLLRKAIVNEAFVEELTQSKFTAAASLSR